MSLADHYQIRHHYVRYNADLRNSLLKEINHRDRMPEPTDDWTYGLEGTYMDFRDYVEAFWLNVVWGLTFQDSWKMDLRCNQGTDRPSCGLEFRKSIENKERKTGDTESN